LDLALSNDLPIVAKLNTSYKLWHGFLIKLPRLTRYTLGVKVDNLFSDCLELSLIAGYTARAEKYLAIQKLSIRLDLLKFFLKVLWELKGLDNQKYTTFSVQLTEIGKMIGGWLTSLKKETLPSY